jgi:hypothetical protein
MTSSGISGRTEERPLLLDAALFGIQERRDDFAGFLARHHWHDVKGHAEPPAVQDPLLQQPGIVAFHQLKTAVELGLDPAANIFQAFGKFDSGIAHPAEAALAAIENAMAGA